MTKMLYRIVTPDGRIRYATPRQNVVQKLPVVRVRANPHYRVRAQLGLRAPYRVGRYVVRPNQSTTPTIVEIPSAAPAPAEEKKSWTQKHGSTAFTALAIAGGVGLVAILLYEVYQNFIGCATCGPPSNPTACNQAVSDYQTWNGIATKLLTDNPGGMTGAQQSEFNDASANAATAQSQIVTYCATTCTGLGCAQEDIQAFFATYGVWVGWLFIAIAAIPFSALAYRLTQRILGKKPPPPQQGKASPPSGFNVVALPTMLAHTYFVNQAANGQMTAQEAADAIRSVAANTPVAQSAAAWSAAVTAAAAQQENQAVANAMVQYAEEALTATAASAAIALSTELALAALTALAA
jgi:hypothetical protein